MKSKNRCFKLSNGTLKSLSASWPTENATSSGRWNNDLSGRMALKINILPLDKPKTRLWWGRESDDSSGRQELSYIFFLLTSPKCDLGEVDKSMFQGLALHFQLIYGLLPIQNATWGGSRNRCFKCSHGTMTLFSALDKPKMRLCWGRGSEVSSRCQALRTHFQSLDLQKIHLLWVQESDVSSGCKALRTHILTLD